MSDPTSRRAQGKSAVRARTHWVIEIGQRLSVRCVQRDLGPVLEMRANGKWREVTTGASAEALFRKFSASETLSKAFEKKST